MIEGVVPHSGHHSRVGYDSALLPLVRGDSDERLIDHEDDAGDAEICLPVILAQGYFAASPRLYVESL